MKFLIILYIKARILLKKILIIRNNNKFAKKVKIDFYTILETNISIGDNCNIQSSHIGTGTYISENSCIQHTKIGRFCAIADNVRSGMGTHPVEKNISIHPAFFSTIKQAGFTFVKENTFCELKKVMDSNFCVEVGNDVWIGSGVKIIDGVKIGNGAIIGANAVVTKNIEPYTINVGVPAKPIKKRFTDKQIQFLEDFKWWDKDFDWIKENAHQFNDIENFMKKFSKNRII